MTNFYFEAEKLSISTSLLSKFRFEIHQYYKILFLDTDFKFLNQINIDFNSNFLKNHLINTLIQDYFCHPKNLNKKLYLSMIRQV